MNHFWSLGAVKNLHFYCSLWIILLSTLFFCYQYKANYFDTSGLRPQMVDTLKKLEHYSELPGFHVGYRGTPSHHLKTTYWFSKHLNYKEAKRLLHHSNTFIQALAIKRLSVEQAAPFVKLAVAAYNDTTSYIYQASGCTGNTYTLFEYYLEIMGYPYPFLEDTIKWADGQKQLIDSLAMTTTKSNYYMILKMN